MKQIIDGIEKVATISDDLRDYQFSHIDDTTDTLYASFVNAKGEYYFKKIDDTSCLFFRGIVGNYTSDWADKTNKSYQLFNLVF